MKKETQPHLIELLAKLAFLRGLRDIAKTPGLTSLKINDDWSVKINSHDESVGGILPGSFYLEFNGWPAGVISLNGEGEMAAGDAANEMTLKRVLAEEIEKAAK